MFGTRTRSVVVASVLAVTGVLGATAVASAQPGTLQPGKGNFAQYWQGHGRQLTLAPDGTGTMTMFDGAADGTTWTVAWARSTDPAIAITLTDQTAVYGNGFDDTVGVGTMWFATIVSAPDNGHGILHFTDTYDQLTDVNAGFFSCGSDGPSQYCGA